MKKSTRILGVAAVTAIGSLSGAAMAGDDQSYGSKFSDKATHGLANMVTGWVELPKNIINTSTEYTILGGVTLGVVRGAFEAATRTVVGVGELLTSPIPTGDYVTPGYVWERFSEDTRYFHLAYPLYWTRFGPLDDGEPLRLE